MVVAGPRCRLVSWRRNADVDSEQLPRPEYLREDLEDHRHPQPDQHPEAVLREVPPGGCPTREARGHWTAGGIQVGLPDPRLQRDLLAGVRELPPGEAQVRR